MELVELVTTVEHSQEMQDLDFQTLAVVVEELSDTLTTALLKTVVLEL